MVTHKNDVKNSEYKNEEEKYGIKNKDKQIRKKLKNFWNLTAEYPL